MFGFGFLKALFDSSGNTEDRIYTLPDASGTLALTSDICGVTVVVTATSITAIAGQHVHVTAAGQTVTLPASPAAGDRVTVSIEAFYDTIIARNGQNIMGLAEDFTIDQRNFSITFTYISATRGWQI